MAEWLNPYDLPEDDEQRRLHLGRYNWAKEHIKGSVVANAACSCNYGYSILNDGTRLVIGFDRNPVGLNLARSSGADLVIEKTSKPIASKGLPRSSASKLSSTCETPGVSSGIFH